MELMKQLSFCSKVEAASFSSEKRKKMTAFLKLCFFLILFGRISASVIKVSDSGRASYFEGIPSPLHGASSISNCQRPAEAAQFQPCEKKLSENYKNKYGNKIIPTHQWWSSLVWRRCLDVPGSLGSMPMHAYPLSVQARLDGLEIGYPLEVDYYSGQGTAFPFLKAYKHPHQPFDFLVRVSGLEVPAVQLDDYSDLTVTMRWGITNHMLATMGRGLPFVYFTSVRQSGVSSGETVQLIFQGRITVWSADAGGQLGVSLQTFRGPAAYHHYGIFLQPGMSWVQTDGQDANGAPQSILTAQLVSASSVFWSIAVLPSPNSSLLALYR